MLKKVFVVIFWSFVFLLLTSNGAAYLDPDFGWHLKVGEKISQVKSAPNIEYFDYTLEGKSWVDHEWFLNYLVFLIYDNFGYFSLVIIFSLLALVAFFILYLFIIKKNKKHFENNFPLKVLLLLLMYFGIHASLPHLGVRMQEITLLNVILLLIVLDSYTQNKNWKTLLFLPPLFVFWANFHGGFLIGLFMLGMFISVKYIELISYKFKKLKFLKYENVFNIKQIKTIFIFSVFSFLSTLATPYGIKMYSFLVGYTDTFYLTNIAEWLPFYYLPILYEQIFYISISFSVVFIFIFFVFVNSSIFNKKNVRFSIWEISIFFVFLFLALKSRRHFPLFFVLTLPFVFSLYIKLFEESFLHLKNLINYKILSFFAISVLAMLVVNQFFKINYINKPFESFCKSYPCGAVEYLKENKNLQSKRVFNDYGWGGFLIWTLPDMKLFIDGRLPQFEYKGHSMLKEYRDFFEEESSQNKLDENNIEMVFIKTKKKEIKLNWFEKYFLGFKKTDNLNKDNPLLELMKSSDSWEEIYADEISSIYLKI